ncbi:MAG TPA: GNAT family protein, partial [Polyangia bacterium]|nr:GNAT family protein [Polyangia bacterium]
MTRATKPPAGEAKDEARGEEELAYQQREQILKLVTKAFFNELTKYGIRKEEVLRVASHLLDNVMSQQARGRGAGAGASSAPDAIPFLTDAVQDQWRERERLSLEGVSLSPLEGALIPRVADWLRVPAVRDSFVPPFPAAEADLRVYFARADQEYFAIHHDGDAVGIIGGENIDRASGKLEMKKLIGDANLRGKGIGKRATFLFLYWAFTVSGMHKVYVHSRDINVRNINLNSGFGFELEGALLEDAVVDGRRVDLVRMALLAPIWKA